MEVTVKRRHEDIIKFCKRFMRENGYPPSIREIGDGVGLKSTSSVVQYMHEMRDIGLITIGQECSPRAFCIAGARYVFEDDEKPVQDDGGSE